MSVTTSGWLLWAAFGAFGSPGEESTLVLRGLDPVRLCEGRSVDGSEGITAEREGYLYRFVDESSRSTFLADPERYQVQLGGCCARMGALSGKGSPERYVVHEGRIYLFASDGCREGFLEAPATCLDPDQTPSTTEAAAREKGAQWVERALDFFGGKERFAAWHSYHRERRFEEKSSGRTYQRREALTVEFGRGVRSDSDWGTDYRSATLVAGETAVQIANGKVQDAVSAAGRRQVDRDLHREPWFLLRAHGEDGFHAAELGVHENGGRQVARVEIAYRGTVTVLQIDTATGEVLAACYRGHRPDARFGEIVDRYEDWADCDGLELPRRIRRSYPGSDRAELVLDFDSIVVDGEMPNGWSEIGG